jgi:phage gp16-like protein
VSRVYTHGGKRGGMPASMRTALGGAYRPPSDFANVVPIRPQAAPPKEKAKFPPDPQRRVMIAKIKIAQKDLDFDDGDYRALLDRVTGKVSCTTMSLAELGKVLDEFKRLGWAPVTSQKSKSVPGRPPLADHPGARKARALWISLSLLGAIRQPTEAALQAFARRQMGCQQLQWADQSQVYKLIEALKAFAQRLGWDQSVAGLADPIWTLKYRLVAAIVKRMVAAGALPAGATIATVIAERLGHDEAVQQVSERELETLASQLGRDLAAHVAADYYED